VPLAEPFPIEPLIEPEVTDPLCDPGLSVPLVLLLADPFGDCWVPDPPALIPESILPLGRVTIPVSELPPLGVTAALEPAALSGPLVCAKAKLDVARLMHKPLTTNKRDISYLLVPPGVTRRAIT
jgi:hypothetical protein